MRKRSVLLVPAMVAATAVPLGMATSAAAETPTELFFSEYIEGSSNNKALEIYNGTGAAVDLSGYSVEMFFNGSTAGTEFELAGTVADGDVFVLAHSSADPAVLAQADLTSGAGFFNGDDAVALTRDGAIVDVIGQIGFDPGSQWGTGDVSTADNTLRRLASVCAGDTDGSDPFDPATAWAGFATNTFDGLGAHTTECEPSGPVDPVINEFSASTAGTDVEFIEFLAEPLTDLSGYAVLQVEGDFNATTDPRGVVDSSHPAGTTDADGFWLAALDPNTLENGTISLLLVSGDVTGVVGTDIDVDNDGVIDDGLPFEVVDSVAVHDGGADDLTYGAPALGVSYDGLPFAPGGASRIPDGTDTDSAADWVRNDFDLAGLPGFTGTPAVGEAYNTPGAPNAVVEPPEPGDDTCETPITPIYEIQGDGAASPLDGQSVLTEGVVVGEFITSDGDRAVYIQDAEGDGDPATSDGIYVFADVADDIVVGDTIRVRGTVDEFFEMTELTNVAAVFTCGDGTTEIAPTEIVLPLAGPDALEPLEGMLVTLPQELTIAEYFEFDRFGQIVLSLGRHMTPTAVVEPGPAAIELAAQQELERIRVDDARGSQNPDPAIHPNGEEFTLANSFRGGDLVTGVTGVLDYQFGNYAIQPTQGAEYTAVNERPTEAPDVGSDFTVASFNVLNYFTTLGSRGADTAEELERQEDKIVAALAEMDADVVGLIEIENNTAAIARLVDALNAEMGAGTYDYVDTGVIGTDEIKTAFIYQPASAALVGDYAILDSSVDPDFIDTANRPVLAQTFEDLATGGVVTVAVNHLKSKGSDCDALGDPDTGDGQGNCNLTRTAAAEAMVEWLAGDPTGSGSENNLIIGDLNAYDKEDPIDAIVGAGYTDLIALYEGENAYSYVFDGKLGYLDHGLANDALLDNVTGAAVWNINADEPDLIDYDMTFKQPAQDALYAPDPYRSSDHDPVLIGLDLATPDTVAPTLTVELSHESLWPANHKYVTVTAEVTAADDSGDVTVELVDVTSNEPDNGPGDGNTVDDIVIVDDTTFQLRAERAGGGDGRIYTVTYRATDAAGNETTATATVTVPVGRGR
ncbi:ExeM/NucH family extracellular endonuclease [Georgenia subflava]|uniref:ExeM/NucH family extracellular endonuclease n=1 Tax=Georgenia subflava TaxID=1622177 RepID=A0A6N7EJD2_9MICO|nr:ExeM/NucH family extracellular endonuclease [Georgenia subflava]MPV36857.1 ExeM/NucH family extracellular endonuclease [Georgenia subflava]